MSKTVEYKIWKGIIKRCYNPNDSTYYNYGGRGIGVCDLWRYDFVPFYEDMGPRPKNHSIDRIDPDVGYYPKNCRWATAIEQSNNLRKNTRVVIGSTSKTIAQWAREYGVKPQFAYTRYRSGFRGESVFLPHITRAKSS